jgi:hypothetical protein
MSAIPTPTATFAVQPCRCCRKHTPVPVSVELHHMHPQYDQIMLWGEVRNRKLMPLCRTTHRNLHDYLTAIMAGAPPPRVSAYTAALAREGLRLITEAHVAANVPIPPGGGGE